MLQLLWNLVCWRQVRYGISLMEEKWNMLCEDIFRETQMQLRDSILKYHKLTMLVAIFYFIFPGGYFFSFRNLVWDVYPLTKLSYMSTFLHCSTCSYLLILFFSLFNLLKIKRDINNDTTQKFPWEFCLHFIEFSWVLYCLSSIDMAFI